MPHAWDHAGRREDDRDHLCYYDMFMDSLLGRGERASELRIPEKRACKIEKKEKKKKMVEEKEGTGEMDGVEAEESESRAMTRPQ